MKVILWDGTHEYEFVPDDCDPIAEVLENARYANYGRKGAMIVDATPVWGVNRDGTLKQSFPVQPAPAEKGSNWVKFGGTLVNTLTGAVFWVHYPHDQKGATIMFQLGAVGHGLYYASTRKSVEDAYGRLCELLDARVVKLDGVES